MVLLNIDDLVSTFWTILLPDRLVTCMRRVLELFFSSLFSTTVDVRLKLPVDVFTNLFAPGPIEKFVGVFGMEAVKKLSRLSILCPLSVEWFSVSTKKKALKIFGPNCKNSMAKLTVTITIASITKILIIQLGRSGFRLFSGLKNTSKYNIQESYLFLVIF